MLKKRDIIKGKKPSIISALNMKCGECLHFKKFPRGKSCCCTQGIRAFASAPVSCFQPDYTLVGNHLQQFATLATLMGEMSSKETKVIMSILANAHKSKNKRFPFGTKVYIRNGRDYISNYLSVFVLGYTKEGLAVISGSPNSRERGGSFIGYVDQDSLLDYDAWNKKKKQLISLGNINDKRNHNVIVSPEKFEPEVPTIDTAPKAWTKKRKTGKKDVYEKITSFTVLDEKGM